MNTRLCGILVVLLGSIGILPGQEKARPDIFVDIHGAPHAPLESKTSKAIVLFFVTNDCPVANYYSSEINAIVKDHAKKPVRFYIVHVDPELTPADARKHAKAYGFNCPVLIDDRHRLVKATGVTITPEVALLTAGGKIAYRGRIDDCYVEPGKRRVAPNQRDLRDALTAVLAGRPVTEPRTQAVGCFIPELR